MIPIATFIMRALFQGYTIDKIMSMLSSKGGNISKQINAALKQGYSQDEIGEYLTKGKSKSYSERNAMLSPQTEREKASRIFYRGSNIADIGKGLLGAGATAGLALGGAYGLKKGIGAIKNGMRRGGGENGVGPTIDITPSAPSSGGAEQDFQQGTGKAPPSETQHTPLTPEQKYKAQQPPLSKSSQILEELGLKQKISNLFKSGTNPEQIYSNIESSLNPIQQNYLNNKIKSGQAKDLRSMIDEYLPELQAETRSEAKQKIDLVPDEKREAISKFLNEEQGLPETPQKPVKGAIVSTPDGLIGEIRDIKQKDALIEANGKLHKVKADEIERTPEELIQTAQDLLKIPEVDRSAVISLVTYRPASKQMFIQFHNGETYVYEDVPEDQAKEIADAMGTPITSGKNIFGAWEEGKKDSRGAALIHGIIRDPKYAKDNEGKTWEKLGTYYDYWKKLRKPSKRKKQ